MFKKFAASLMVGTLLGFQLFGAVISTNLPNASRVSLIPGPLTLLSITAQNVTNSGVATIYFIDAPSTSVSFTNNTYITRGFYTTNANVVTYTNFFGLTNSWTNSALISYSITNSAATNPYTIIQTFVINSNATAISQFTQPVFVPNGLLVTNVGGVVITVEYER